MKYINCSDGFLPITKEDLIVTALKREGGFEEIEREFLRRILVDCRTFVDVGANLGIYTLLAARHLRAGSKVFSFEAAPREFRKLRYTLSKNRIGRKVVACNVAVSSYDGKITIHQHLGGGGALNRVDGPSKPHGEWDAVEIPCCTLDSFFANYPKVRCDFIKIDVEGHELPVLLGAEKLIMRDHPILMIEMNDARSSSVSRPEAVWEWIAARGFAWFGLKAGGFQLVPMESPPEYFGYLNLFALPPLEIRPRMKEFIDA